MCDDINEDQVVPIHNIDHVGGVPNLVHTAVSGQFGVLHPRSGFCSHDSGNRSFIPHCARKPKLRHPNTMEAIL